MRREALRYAKRRSVRAGIECEGDIIYIECVQSAWSTTDSICLLICVPHAFIPTPTTAPVITVTSIVTSYAPPSRFAYSSSILSSYFSSFAFYSSSSVTSCIRPWLAVAPPSTLLPEWSTSKRSSRAGSPEFCDIRCTRVPEGSEYVVSLWVFVCPLTEVEE
jgi:hypothetical protein